jgi:hypothetical protein
MAVPPYSTFASPVRLLEPHVQEGEGERGEAATCVCVCVHCGSASVHLTDQRSLSLSIPLSVCLSLAEPLTGQARGSVDGDVAPPLKEGWLRKLGHNLQRDWRPRYVIVRAGTFAYFRSYDESRSGRPIATLELVASLVRLLPGYRGRFEVETATKIYTFEAKTEAEAQAWVDVIARYIAASIAKISTLLEVR